jgi:hypothetical protein
LIIGKDRPSNKETTSILVPLGRVKIELFVIQTTLSIEAPKDFLIGQYTFA